MPQGYSAAMAKAGSPPIPAVTDLQARWRTALTWWRARPTLVAAVLYAALALLMVSPGLAPGRVLSSADQLYSFTPWTASVPEGVRPFGGSNFELQDQVLHSQPFLRYTRERLPDIPLWNPLILGGFPFVADAQSAVFSPFSVPSYVLPFGLSLAVAAALKLFAAAFGTYLLGRALGMRYGGALLAGVVYAFGLFMVVWLSSVLASVWVLIPWLLLLTELVVRRPGPLPVAGLATVVALQFFAGHPESSFHALFTAAAFLILRLVQRHRARGTVIRPALGWAAALVAGTALAAVMLIPFLEALSYSRQTEQRVLDPEPARYLLGLFLADYWGRPTQVLTDDPVNGFSYNHVFYAGALTLMLTPAAVVLRPRVERIAVAAFGLFAIAMVVGIEPVFGLVSALPFFDITKNGRMIVLALLSMALLAAWALDDLSGAGAKGRRGQFVLGMSAAIFCVPLAYMVLRGRVSLSHLDDGIRIAWFFQEPHGRVFPPLPALVPSIRLAALFEWIVFAGAALILVGFRTRGRLAAPTFVGLAVALVAADLFKVGMGQNPAIPDTHASPPVTPAMRELLVDRPNRFAGLTLALPSNVGMNYGLYDGRGYDYPVERRVDTFWRTNINGLIGDLPPVFANGDRRARHALGLLSVTRILQPPNDEALGDARLVYRGPDARIYANEYALPRAFLVSHQRVVDGDEAALDAVSSLSFDGRRQVVTETRVSGVAEGVAPARRAPGRARLAGYEGERVMVDAAATRPSVLVLTDVWYPGWKATVDGRPTRLHRVNYLLRGVEVPAGSHRVTLEYRPASWTAGWVLSLLSIFALLTAVVVGVRQRQR
jgi:hypothetical protein